ncbi:hypothetical protein Vau01_121630 [Virgisporangium aurantiacum]|uniref:Uncharacterized protein n=1 Tax=Virgisporangium aurantiacum TaxID=175570 RepID=A0A8J4EAC8_9ACTN|nr:hypothetical protein Vau01_121630 [Virgisporangium aurantiacum]
MVADRKVGPLYSSPTHVAGTSFAAPRLAFRQALYLVSGGKVDCGRSPDPVVPPLGYVEKEAAGVLMWRNRPMDETSAEYCSDFNSLTAELR